MEKRTIIAILLCVGIWILWQQVFMEPMEPMEPMNPSSGSVDGGVASANNPGTNKESKDSKLAPKDNKVEEGESKPPTERPEEQLASLKNDKFEVILSSRGASFKHVKLFGFKERIEGKSLEESELEDVVSTKEELFMPLRLRMGGEKSSFKLPAYTDWQVTDSRPDRVTFRYEDPENFEIPTIIKTYTLGKGVYQIEMELELINRGESSLTAQPILEMFGFFEAAVSSGCGGVRMAPRQPMCLAGEEVLDVEPEAGAAITGKPNILWTGINEQYFLFAAVTVDTPESVCKLESRHDQRMVSSLIYPDIALAPGGSFKQKVRIYAGPKQWNLLEQVKGGKSGDERNAMLTNSVDFGWFAFLCHPMLWLLKFFYSFLGNYGLAIIFLTIIIKLLLLPLTQKSMASMREMAKIKPLMEDLKKKYGEDKQKMNEETMKMYKTHKVNPMGGCLPMMMQMPIWIALYRMLYSSVELYQAPFIPGWLNDLSYRDPYFIMPIVLGATMFLQQKLSPTSVDSQQAKMMMYMMPAFFTFIMLYLPSGLVLYIFVNSVLSIAHQLIYNHIKGSPTAGMTNPAQAKT